MADEVFTYDVKREREEFVERLRRIRDNDPKALEAYQRGGEIGELTYIMCGTYDSELDPIFGYVI